MKEFSAETGQVLPEVDPANTPTGEFQFLPLNVIVASLTNPRKSFRLDKMAELAESIKASGVHQPILLRPLPGSRVQETAFDPLPMTASFPFPSRKEKAVRPTHEIVAGERRYRASIQAGVATIPALIRDLSDEQVFEIQLVENLQRDDLTELEEAEGYEQLMQRTGLNADAVGGKIGKSRSYVYARLKLLDLTMECKEAMRSGLIDASRALLIARIPDTKLQTKALAEATKADWRGEVPSVRALQAWLQANVMLRLENAPFRIADARLVEAAGSCKECPKRTGANPDLFADVQGADICTDPPCYNGKLAAHRAALLARAEAKGMRVIDGAEAKEIFPYHGSYMHGYTSLSQVREDLSTEGEVSTLGKLLGKDGPERVLIENPHTKELIEAVPTDEAEAMLLARGLIKVTATQERERDIDDEIETLKKRAERDTDFAFRAAAFPLLQDAIRNTPDKHAASLISPTLLREWMIRSLGEDEHDRVAESHGIELTGVDYDEDKTQLRLHIQACDSAKLYKALALRMILDDVHANVRYYSEVEPATLFEALASDLKINLTVIEKEAGDSVKKETAAKIRALKAELKAKTEAEKPVTPNTPAALAIASAGGPGAGEAQGSGVKGPGAKTAAPLRKRKLSAAEAQAAIAGAMQDQETESGAAGASQGNDAVSGCALPDAAATVAWPWPYPGASGDAPGNDADSSQPVAASGASAPALAPEPALSVGTKVQIKATYADLEMTQRKWASKKGVITAYASDYVPAEGSTWLRYNVTFRGRNGGVAGFLRHQFEVLPS